MSNYFSKYYQNHLMDSFAYGFSKNNSTQFGKNPEVLFRNLIIDEKVSETLSTRNWNNFKRTSKDLVHIGYYSSIIRFMFGVFLHGDVYNLNKFKEKLSEIQLDNGKNLADLTSEFYLEIKEKENKIFGEDTPKDLDVFTKEASEYFSSNTYSPRDITKSLPVFIVKNILDYDLDIENLNRNEIDEIAYRAMDLKEKMILEEEKSIEKINRKTEESEKKLNGKMNLSRLVKKKNRDFDKEILLPGIMLEIFKAAELSGQDDLSYYILYKYVWPVFSKTPWKEVNRVEVQNMALLMKAYLDYKYSLVMKNNNMFHVSETSMDYDQNMFFEELIKNEKGSLMKTGIELGGKYPRLSLEMAETLSKGNKLIKDLLPDYLYSFALSFTSYLLYSSGHIKEASNFLIKYYDDISFYDKRMYYLQFTLIKSILNSENLGETTVLYGYYNYEMDRQEREKGLQLETIEEIIEYILDIREYLELGNEHTLGTRKSWQDVVFGNGEIIKDIELARKSLDKDIVPEESLFRRLMLYVEALSYNSGIRLPLLNLENEDGYDKLPNALSKELINRGEGFMGELDENLSYYHSIKNLQVRKRINVFIQDHIYNLMDKAIDDSVETIKELRKEFISKHLEKHKIGDADDLKSDLESEELFEAFDNVMESLSKRLVMQYIGREEIDKRLINLQKSFIGKYNLEVENFNLIDSLPESIQDDCYNYIVTSEIVFEVLSNRDDRDELDFSSALIPLTKTLELILDKVFKKMNVREYKGISPYDRKSYFERNGKKKKSTMFGPYVNLLADGFIDVREKDGRVKFNWSKRYLKNKSRFKYWEGGEVVDFSKLRKFKGLYVLFEKAFYDRRVLEASFTEDDEYNRMLFIKNLEYIKDNYRNVVAHKDGVDLETFKEAKNMLLKTKEILLILIYIIDLEK